MSLWKAVPLVSLLQFLIHSLLGSGEQGRTEDIKQCPLLSYPAPHPIGRIFYGSRRHTVSPNDTIALSQYCLPTQKLKPSRFRQARTAHRLICPHCRQLISSENNPFKFWRDIIASSTECMECVWQLKNLNFMQQDMFLDQCLCL